MTIFNLDGKSYNEENLGTTKTYSLKTKEIKILILPHLFLTFV